QKSGGPPRSSARATHFVVFPSSTAVARRSESVFQPLAENRWRWRGNGGTPLWSVVLALPRYWKGSIRQPGAIDSSGRTSHGEETQLCGDRPGRPNPSPSATQ